MFGFTATTDDQTRRVQEAATKANFRNFNHAAASISKDAKASIETDDKPSAPGTPPHTRKGQIRRGIRYAADQNGAVIGPTFSSVGLAGEAQEMGGEYKGEEYPARPFMAPALERAVPRLAGEWAGTIGQ